MLVQELLRRTAQQYPDHPALVANERRWTYGELAAQVGRLATALRSRGLRPGDRVAVDLASQSEAVPSIWATLEAGGVFACLDPSSPPLSFIELLEDFRPRILITRPERLTSLDGCSLPDVIECGDGGSGNGLRYILHEGPTQDLVAPAVEPQTSLANLVYTSGSTGLPKGVMMTHAAMAAAIDAITTYLRTSAQDVTLNVLPLSFDYGLYQVLMAGATGSCVVLEPGFGYPGILLSKLRDERVTTLPGVPTLFALLLRLESFRTSSFPALRTFTNTGAGLAEWTVGALKQRFPESRLYLMYGLTECKRVSYLDPEEVARRPTSVGKAMPGCQTEIVDEEGRPVGPGRRGELVVKGANLMSGYWQRPKETAAVLRRGPWPGEDCLYTGDLFRRDEEGFLYFVGRRDDILKCRGQKVAPVEVEATLLAMEGVAEAAVVGVDHPTLGQSIVAVVVLQKGWRLTSKKIRGYCARNLEAFKVPARVLIVGAMPRGSRGKIDKEVLKVLTHDDDIDPGARHTAPPQENRLTIDPHQECERIEAFLREQLGRHPRRRGYVVGLSGGIDSAVTAVLVHRALGTKASLGVLLPERESQPQSADLARALASRFGLEILTEDLTPPLDALGVYDRREAIVRSVFPAFGSGWTYRLKLPGDLRASRELNFYQLEVRSPDGIVQTHRLAAAAYRCMQAATSVKQRLRMLRLYEHAEARAFLVAGTTNRTELVQGFFVKHGDGGVDVEPLAHLYKTQVYELARYIQIPEAIVERPPSPDTFSAPVSDEEFYFRLPYSVLDRMLACFEAGETAEHAALECETTREDAGRIYQELKRRRFATTRLRELPPSLGPDPASGQESDS